MERLHDFNPETDLALDVPAVVEIEGRIAASGTSLRELMDRAGAALAESVMAIVPLEAEHVPNVLAVCGSGNNGGDGWVCAALLAQEGYPVDIVATRLPADLTAQPARDAALEASQTLEAHGRAIIAADDPSVARRCAEADVIVDALLGTGFSGDEVKGAAGALIDACQQSPALIVSADVPSGVSAQTGHAADPAVTADYTVTMIAAKTGLPEAEERCGRLLVAPLGVDVHDYL